MDSVLEWFKAEPLRKIGALIFLVLAIFGVIYSIHSSRSAVLDSTRYKLYMDSETGKTFTVELEKGMTIPVISPDTGKATGYPPEACYWNADGSTKSTPTYVILNSYLGKSGPTFCPDCGRLVVLYNPTPHGQPPPPTREEYERLHRGYSNP